MWVARARDRAHDLGDAPRLDRHVARVQRVRTARTHAVTATARATRRSGAAACRHATAGRAARPDAADAPRRRAEPRAGGRRGEGVCGHAGGVRGPGRCADVAEGPARRIDHARAGARHQHAHRRARRGQDPRRVRVRRPALLPQRSRPRPGGARQARARVSRRGNRPAPPAARGELLRRGRYLRVEPDAGVAIPEPQGRQRRPDGRRLRARLHARHPVDPDDRREQQHGLGADEHEPARVDVERHHEAAAPVRRRRDRVCE